MVIQARSDKNPGSNPGSRVHLDRALSKLGILSRGPAAKAIQAGEVTVSGKVIRDPKFWVDWRGDKIHWSGQGPASSTEPGLKRYGVLHKPKGYVTTRQDELERDKIVYALLPEEAQGGWIFPVGRLDKDSEGLLLFTNDGPWAEGLTGPDSHGLKRYRVKLDHRLLENDRMAFVSGLMIDSQKTLPCEALLQTGTWVEVVLREGRNRQIRRMFQALGYKVKRLIRIGIGDLTLDASFEPGAFRWLTSNEIASLAKPKPTSTPF